MSTTISAKRTFRFQKTSQNISSPTKNTPKAGSEIDRNTEDVKDKMIDATKSIVVTDHAEIANDSRDVQPKNLDMKQDTLLKILSRFNPDLCIKELDVRLHSCQIALELLEQQKILILDLLRTLKDQRLKVGLLKVKQTQMESLKYCNKFPEDHKLAVKMYDYYMTDLKILQSEELRTKGRSCLPCFRHVLEISFRVGSMINSRLRPLSGYYLGALLFAIQRI